MTAHQCTQIDLACYRCELNVDEVGGRIDQDGAWLPLPDDAVYSQAEQAYVIDGTPVMTQGDLYLAIEAP